MISAVDAREGSIVDFSESGPTLLVEVDVISMGGHLVVVCGAWGKLFASHRLDGS